MKMKMKTKAELASMTKAELKTEMLKRFGCYLEFLVEDCAYSSISMTAATESIYGSSGRGNPRAVRIIEMLAKYGYVDISGTAKRRRVKVNDEGIVLSQIWYTL